MAGFLDSHPGGRRVLLQYANTDASKPFHKITGHRFEPTQRMLQELQIGVIAPAELAARAAAAAAAADAALAPSAPEGDGRVQRFLLQLAAREERWGDTATLLFQVLGTVTVAEDAPPNAPADGGADAGTEDADGSLNSLPPLFFPAAADSNASVRGAYTPAVAAALTAAGIRAGLTPSTAPAATDTAVPTAQALYGPVTPARLKVSTGRHVRLATLVEHSRLVTADSAADSAATATANTAATEPTAMADSDAVPAAAVDPCGASLVRRTAVETASRAYTPLADFDGRYLLFAIKRYGSAGAVSAALHALPLGATVFASAPAGSFSTTPLVSGRYGRVVCVGAGTGVAPLLQVAARVVGNRFRRPSVLFISAQRSAVDAVAAGDLVQLSRCQCDACRARGAAIRAAASADRQPDATAGETAAEAEAEAGAGKVAPLSNSSTARVPLCSRDNPAFRVAAAGFAGSTAQLQSVPALLPGPVSADADVAATADLGCRSSVARLWLLHLLSRESGSAGAAAGSVTGADLASASPRSTAEAGRLTPRLLRHLLSLLGLVPAPAPAQGSISAAEAVTENAIAQGQWAARVREAFGGGSVAAAAKESTLLLVCGPDAFSAEVEATARAAGFAPENPSRTLFRF
jgi:hypothetical protein